MYYKISDFTNVIHFILNRTEEEFFEMYKSLGFMSPDYAREKREKAIDNFGVWWCNLDDVVKASIIMYVKDFYGA